MENRLPCRSAASLHPRLAGWVSPCGAAGSEPPRDSGSAGGMRSGGQGKGSAPARGVRDGAGFTGGGWEHQSKASVTAPSSFQPGEFTFQLKPPKGARFGWFCGSSGGREGCGMLCREEVHLLQISLPRCSCPQKSPRGGKTRRCPVPSSHRQRRSGVTGATGGRSRPRPQREGTTALQ